MASRKQSSTSESSDTVLIQIVDAALVEAARKSGEWLVCRPGCTQCCVGVFAINQLDVARLQRGMTELDSEDPERAARVRERARGSVERLRAAFPGDPVTGLLDDGEDAQEAFAEFGNEETCPALDPATGTCDLYAARPMTCRVFGPPVRTEGGLGACELCYHGASDEQIASREMDADPCDLESALVAELERDGKRGNTIVAWTLGEPKG